MAEDKVRVLVINSTTIVRKSLIALLQQFPELEIVGEAEDDHSGMSLVETLRPHVVLINLMEISPAIDTTRNIRANYPDTQVIVVSNHSEYGLIHEVFKAGAINYLLNNVTEFELMNAIRQAHIGKTALTVEAVSALMASIYRREKKGLNLTDRERQVLEMMIQGLNNKEIAIKLDISRSTVKNHVNSLFAKLNVDSRVKAVALTLQSNLLDEE